MIRWLAERRSWPALAGAIPVALAAWVYWPLTGCWFWSDDFVHMASIVNDGFLPFVLRPYAGHNLLARNLIFYASWHLFGLHPAPYFWMVLGTHLVNVWLLFRVLRTLTTSATLACVGAALWGTSPIASATLAWYSVYGQALAGTILLVVLDRLAVLARASASLPTRTAWTWYALLLLGTTCFGVALGVALAFPVALFVMLPAAWRQPWVRAAYLALPVVTVLLYIGFRHLYPLLVEPLPFGEVMTQPAGVRDLPAVLAGAWDLASRGASEYPRSFFLAARAYPDRVSPIVLALVGAGVGVVCWRGDGGARRAVVALASLSFGMYVAIALGRVELLRTAMAGQQRYHYVAAVPIVVLACMGVQEIGRVGWLRRVPRGPLAAAALAAGIWGFARSGFRIDQNLVVRTTVEATAKGIAIAVLPHPPGETVYLENGANSKVLLGPMTSNTFFPGRAAIFLLTHGDDQLDGRPVRFVEGDPEIVSRYERRPESPLARLLVRPEAAPGHR